MSKTKVSPDTLLIDISQARSGNVAILTLNAEKTLNSLTIEMVRGLYSALIAYRDDNDIAAIILQGAGKKAFCAGGDVQKLYQSATENPGGPCPYAEDFFKEEYQLNYLIHTYEKPIICLGHGIVMGGGLGLMAGASHRVASDKTRIAMPEITIGLFPDVGGTWFLNRMPRGLGLFFALTGAPINAEDALLVGLADHVISHEKLTEASEAILGLAFTEDKAENHTLVSDCLESNSIDKRHLTSLVPSEISSHVDVLSGACQQSSLGEVIRQLRPLAQESTYFEKALGTLTHGSPLSSLLIFEQLKRYRYASLEKVFESELALATRVIRYPEFAEGVRALLIEKDNAPKWQYAHFAEVPASLLESFFSAPWETSPLTLPEASEA